MLLAMVILVALQGIRPADPYQFLGGSPIQGKLIFPDGVLPREVNLELESEASVELNRRATSNSRGDFAFSGIPAGMYYVVIHGQGFKAVRQAVRVEFGLASILIHLAAAGGASTPGEAVVDVAALRREIPKDARKAMDKAEEALRKRDFRNAESQLEKALKSAPDFYEANLALGLHLQKTGRRDQAIARLANAIKLNPASTRARTALGQIYFETDRFQEAADLLSEAVKLGESSADVYFLMGSSYYKAGAMQPAEEKLLRAIAISPDTMGQAHLQLYNVYIRGRLLEKALDQLEAYLRKFPNAADREEVQARADRLRRELNRVPEPGGNV